MTLVASRLFEAAPFAVRAQDPIAFSVAAVTLLAAGALSSDIPTRRAARVDPVVVLRQS